MRSVTTVDPRTGLEDLAPDVCLALVRSSKLGRLAVIANGRPLVFPVNFTLDGFDVVLRTDEGTTLYEARGSYVAFECDDVDAMYHTGWSVILAGLAEEVLAPHDLARLRRLPLGPWCPGPKPVFLRISPQTITGRRIPPHGMRRPAAREGSKE